MTDYLKQALAATIESRLKHAHNLSADLMKQCVRQDKSPFDAAKLNALDPRYTQEIWDMVKQDASAAWDKRPPGAEQVTFVYDLALSRERDLTAAQGPYQKAGELGKAIDTTSDLDIPPHAMTRAQIRNDIARALGHVTVRVSAGEVTIQDNFDFMQTFRGKPVDSTGLLLFDAGMAGIAMNSTRMLNDIGRVFCKEGVHGEATDSSIPVSITFRPQELGGFAAPRSEAGKPRQR